MSLDLQNNSEISLHPYQEEAITHLFEHDHTLAIMPMGAGKTVITAMALAELIEDGAIKRALIVAPKRVALTVWPPEIEKWGIKLSIAVAIGTPRQRAAAMTSDTDVVVINYENLVWAAKLYDLPALFDAIVFDEITKMKSVGSKRFRAIRPLLPWFKYRLGLTGTLIGNHLMDAYGQAYLIDLGESLGRTKAIFTSCYYYRYGTESWELSPQPGADERLAEDMRGITFSIPDSVYRDQLPPQVDNIIEVDIGGPAYERYKELERDYILYLDEGVVEATTAGVLSNKLRQAAQGFLYHDDGWTELHTAKLDALEEIIDSTDRLIVCYDFRADLERLKKRWPAPHIGAGVSDKQAAITISGWNAGDLPLMYIHPAAAGHGLNLQAGGNTMAWYTLPWSLDLYMQTIARLRRQGQQADQVWNHILVAKQTVDVHVAAALTANQDVQQTVIRGLR